MIRIAPGGRRNVGAAGKTAEGCRRVQKRAGRWQRSGDMSYDVTVRDKNEQCALVFKSGCSSGGGGIHKEQPPTKTSVFARFRQR